MTLTPEHVKLKELADAAAVGFFPKAHADFEDAANPSAILSLLKDLEEAQRTASLSAEMSGALIIEAIGRDQINERFGEGKPIYRDEAITALRELKSRAETAERERDEARQEIRNLSGKLDITAMERDEANARAAVLGEALEETRSCAIQLYGCALSYDSQQEYGEIIKKANAALTSLPAAAKALVRTPGTVEHCSRCEARGHETWAACNVAACPIRSQQGKVNT